MMHLAITRHELERRKAQLADLQCYLSSQEHEYRTLRAQLQVFIDRYVSQLGELYLEHDSLESQLHTAMVLLSEALRRHGMDAREPVLPKATVLPTLKHLPDAAPLPAQPQGGLEEAAAPTLKQLYRRAAMRLHPDLAQGDLQRCEREQQMRMVNECYAAGDRLRLESLLLAAGEDPVKVSGSDRSAQLEWLKRAETLVQGRLRVVQAHLAELQAHAMHRLWLAITQAEAKGLDPLSVMANRLRAQIAERRQELYIGLRLQPESALARDFLRRRCERIGSAC